jgi:integral membrane protein
LTTSENSTETTAVPATAGNAAKIRPALLRYRALAWLLLLTGEMIAKYGFDVHTPSWIAVVHGWVYFVYLLVTADLAVKVRWPALRTVGTLLAGTIPLLSFFVEHVNAKQVKQNFGV